MNEHLLVKIDKENVLGYWNGDEYIPCTFDELPYMSNLMYINLKCNICGREHYKQIRRLLPHCRSCGKREYDLREVIFNKLCNRFDLLGYYKDNNLVPITDIMKLPIYITWTDRIRIKCIQCGSEFDRSLKKLDQKCWNCYVESRTNDWKSLISTSDWNNQVDGKVIGYYLDEELVIESDIDKYPDMNYHSYIQLKCLGCGREFPRRVDQLEGDCPSCSRYWKTRAESKFISTRFGDMPYQSSYELQFIRLCEDNELVTSLCTQPDIKIPYQRDGEFHLYFPDAALIYQNKKYLIEIKPSELVSWECNQLKINAALRYCEGSDITYKIISEPELFEGKLFSNLTS